MGARPAIFKWRQTEPGIILCAVYSLSLRDVEELLAERGLSFFTVPALTFGIPYCFFITDHDRRRILHHNVTRNPNALWVALQLHETWEYGGTPQRFLI
jgi:hypothetical protein